MIDESKYEKYTSSIPEMYGSPDINLGIPLIKQFEEIQNEVRSKLRYKGHATQGEYDQRTPTDCIGFTNLTSELLDQNDLKHKVSFINGHAMITTLLDNGEQYELWMFDSLAPKLNQNVTNSFVPLFITDNAREFAFVFPNYMTTNHDTDRVSPAEKYPWLTLEKTGIVCPDAAYSNGFSKRLIATMYDPKHGRNVLSHYSQYLEAIDRQDIDQIAQSVISMNGVFPDIDIRTDSPAVIFKTIKELTRNDNIESAVAVIDSFYDSFGPSKDSRVTEYRADCYRAIAKITGQSKFAKVAVRFYEETMSRSKVSLPSVSSKLAISKNLV